MKCLILLFVITFSIQSFAQAPDFNSLTQAQVEAVLKDFNGNMTPTTATGAGSLGNIFGIEFGVVASAIDSPNIEAQDSSVDKIANASIYAQVSLPLGFGGEILYTPIEQDDLDYDYKSVAFYWSFGSLVGLPFDAKIKAFAVDAKIDFTDASSGGTVNYDNSGSGASLTIGKKLLFLEPFVGFGVISSDSKMTATASSVFNGSTVEASAASGISDSDGYFFGGLEVNLLFLRLGVEYSNPYGNDRVAGRLAFGF